LRITGSCDPPHFLPPQHGTDAGKQFPETERLDDVVVRPEFETDDAIDFVGAMTGRDNDRNIRMSSNFPQEIQPIVLTQAQIQNDQAGKACLKMTVQFRFV
jgi:hypothetical protein